MVSTATLRLSINGTLFDWMNDDIAGRVTFVDNVMKFFAQYGIYVIVAQLAASWFIRAGMGEQRRIAVYSALVSAGIALAIALMIQRVYDHPRPFVDRTDYVLLMRHAADSSFPSEHATAAFAISAAAGLYRQRLGILMLLIACVIAFSRVYVGVHYPADVGAGAAIGVVSAFAVWLARPLFSWADRAIVRRLVPSFLL